MRELQTKFPKGKIVRDRYVVEELLGQGGFGAVYRVRDRRVRGNIFALKEVVDPNRHQRESFMFEGELLRRLDHYALPRVYRIFEDTKHNRLCMLMDYIEGPNLERLRLEQPEKRFSIPQVLQLMEPIIEAVIYLHAQQPPVIHRDIKPSNIIVPSSGDGSALVDFGIAKEYDQDSTTTAIRHCSPGYGAPEQYVRDTCTRTDIYGLAATCYTLFTGEVPIEALYRITRLSGNRPDPLVPLTDLVPSLPPELSEVILHAMAVNSNDRYASVEEFWKALKACYHEETITALPVLPETVSDESIQCDVVNLLNSAAEEVPATPLPLAPITIAPQPLIPVRTLFRYTSALLAIMFIALLFGGFSGMSAWTRFQPNNVARMLSHTHMTPTSLAQQLSVVPVSTALPPSARSLPTPISIPTEVPVVLPPLAVAYSGSIYNIPAAVNSTVTISQLQQTGNTISGYLSVGPNLLGSGTFSGTVTVDNKVQFLIPSYGKLLPLFFQGEIHANGVITGTYCSYEHDRCNYTGGGYGTWSVTPQ